MTAAIRRPLVLATASLVLLAAGAATAGDYYREYGNGATVERHIDRYRYGYRGSTTVTGPDGQTYNRNYGARWNPYSGRYGRYSHSTGSYGYGRSVRGWGYRGPYGYWRGGRAVRRY